MNGSEFVRLNVGGSMYITTRATLCKFSDSMLGAMFRGDIPSKADSHGNYFIDRDGEMFKYVLNYLRSGFVSLPKDFQEYDLLLNEADFYQIQPLIDTVKLLREKSHNEKFETHYIEIIEIRTGTTATMPSNNSRVKTILLGRKDKLLSLPQQLIGDEAAERLDCKSGLEYVELEIFGSNARIQLADTLRNSGWELVTCDLSSSSSLMNVNSHHLGHSPNMLCIEQSFRDRWKICVKSNNET